MTAAALLAAGGLNALGGVLAGREQRKAQQEEIAAQEAMFNRQVALQEPWRQAGMGALSGLQDLLKNPQSIQDSPAYQFRFEQGNKALERNLAARGGTLGGGALKELTRYGQGMAGDEFQNQFNRLASLAGLGQAATNQTGAYMGNFGAQQAEGIGNLGNIRASSYLGAAGALNQGVGDYMNYNLMRDIYGVGGSSGGSSAGGMKSPQAWEGWGQ